MTRQVGKYQIIRKLATGGMAEVYLAKASGPMGFEKTLVLKCILPRLAEERSFVEMFLSEAKLAARLTHSHIAQIFDFGEADGAYYIAMEYIDGPSVGGLIKKASEHEQPLAPALCARIIAQACEGLAFAHGFVDPETRQPLHLIHRDVSSDNILLSRQGEVKVVDFGIAKAAGQSSHTQVGTVKGKLAYMAPEQLRGEPMDLRADVYALGVVLYELLTGHRPYEVKSKSKSDLMRTLLQDPPTPAATFRPDLPEPLKRMLDQALARDPELRYPDCISFQADLEEFILESGKPVTAQSIAQLITQIDALPPLPELPRLETAPQRKPGMEVPGLVPLPRPAHAPGGYDAQEELTLLATAIRAPASRVAPVPEHTEETMVAPRTDEMKAPRDRSGEISGELFGETPAMPLPAIHSEPLSMKVRSAKRSGANDAPARLRPWMLGLAAVAVLVGAGVLFWRTAPSEPVAPAAPPLAETVAPSQPPPVPADGVNTPPPTEPEPEPEMPEPDMEGPEDSESTPPRPDTPSASSVMRDPQVPPARNGTKGTLVFRISPHTAVFVDGKPLGDTPLAPASLNTGRHTVKLVNARRTVVRYVEIKPGQSTLLKVDFAEK